MNLAQKTRHCIRGLFILWPGIRQRLSVPLIVFAEREACPFRVCSDVSPFMPKSVETSYGVSVLPIPRG